MVILMRKDRKTTTFPLEWNKVKSLESKLLMTFLDSEKLSDGIDLLMINLGSRFGLRVGDLIQLKYRDLNDLPVGEDLVVRERKTGKLRVLRMTTKVKTVVNQVVRLLDPDPNHFIFTSTHKKGVDPMTIQNFNLRLKRILKSNNVRTKGNVSSHLLRKSFVLGTIQNGFKKGDHLSLVKVSHLVNHSSVNQTIKYVNYETSEMMELMDLD